MAGHGIWTRDLPNASVVRHHGATSFGKIMIFTIIILDIGTILDMKFVVILYPNNFEFMALLK